jgi:hypothetical protein
VRGQLKVLSAFAVLFAFLILGVTFASAVAPTVTVDNASAVSYTSAHVSGEVDPQGQSTTYRFQYITEAQVQENLANFLPEFEGASTGPEATIEGAAQPVAGDLTNLTPATTYHLRLVAENADGSVEAIAASTFPTLAVAAPTVSIDPVTTITDSAAHFSGDINPGAPPGNPSGFDVNWHFECDPDCPGLVGGTISADSSPHQVSADATGLNPGTTYEVRLVASNAGGPATAGLEDFSTATVAPEIQGSQATALSTEATLKAQINPGGLATKYHFEYGTSASYGSSTEERTLAAGGSTVNVKADLFGLSPATTYHFRVVASNSLGSVKSNDLNITTLSSASGGGCSNESIRIQQQATSLPDCRAYEQASPVDKNNADVTPGFVTSQSSPDGNRLAFGSTGGFAGTRSVQAITSYITTRSPDAWSTVGIEPPTTTTTIATFAGLYGAFSSDLSRGIFAAPDPPLVPGAPTGRIAGSQIFNLYSRDNEDDAYELLTPNRPYDDDGANVPEVTGGSSDFSVVAFDSQDALTPNAPFGPENQAYEWRAGDIRLVGILPNGSVAPGGANVGFPIAVMTPANTVSADGSKVFFRSPAAQNPLQVSGSYELYVREDGETTTQISASRRTPVDPNGPGSALFWGASASGGDVVFTDTEKLTDDATADPANLFGDLYKYDTDAGELLDLSVDNNDPEGADVQGVVGTADGDASYVYFVAKGTIVDGEGEAGQPNLYVGHAGTTHYITTLSPGDSKDWEFSPRNRTARISSDGERLAFVSSAPLTGYDNHVAQGESCGKGAFGVPLPAACPQVFLYDADADRLSCLSCRQDGSRPEAASGLGSPGASSVLFGGLSIHEPNNFSTDGKRLYFESADALLPQDSNGTNDVYQWQAGRIGLVSDGNGLHASTFADASASGDDVFIATADRLVSQDQDNNIDVYDARVGGGISSQNQLPPAPPCQGEECRRPPAGAPRIQVPASSTLSGPINPARRGHKKRHPKRKPTHHHRKRQHKAHQGKRGVRSGKQRQ